MIRTLESTGKTVEEAVKAGCATLGVAVDSAAISYEVLTEPVHKLFKNIPAKVLITLEEPDAAEAPAPREEAPAQPAESAEAPAQQPEEVAIDLAENPKAQAAAAYVAELAALMGAENVTITAVQKGEATILKLTGEHVNVLIGRRGETMESLSYLASLVANRLEGDYMKLGLDVSGYRDKRENDLEALGRRLGERVIRNNRAYEMEPMNPYERRLIHSAIGRMEGVRSESRGEGNERHVVIYSTAEGANNDYPERERRAGGRSQRGGRPGNGRGGRNNRSGRSYGGRERGERSHGSRGGRPSNVPERRYNSLDTENAAPVAPKRTEKVDDFADFSFGKIEF